MPSGHLRSAARRVRARVDARKVRRVIKKSIRLTLMKECRDESRRGRQSVRATHIRCDNIGTVVVTMYRIVAFFALLFLLTFAAVAGTVQGTIKDPSGAVVAGAQISVRDAAGLTVRTVSSDGQGRFSVDGLDPGAYSVIVDRAGFEAARRDFVVENDGKKLDLIIELKLQSQETVVE